MNEGDINEWRWRVAREGRNEKVAYTEGDVKVRMRKKDLKK